MRALAGVWHGRIDLSELLPGSMFIRLKCRPMINKASPLSGNHNGDPNLILALI